MVKKLNGIQKISKLDRFPLKLFLKLHVMSFPCNAVVYIDLIWPFFMPFLYNGVYVTEGFGLRVRAGLKVALSYVLDFHL